MSADELTAAPTGWDPSQIHSAWTRHQIAAAMNVIVVMMRKGGAGKTTLVLLLADALARFGLNVLVVDMDPQGNASSGLGRAVVLRQVGTSRIGNRAVMQPVDLTVCEVIESGERGVADEAIALAEWEYVPDDAFVRGGPLFPGLVGAIGVIPCYERLEADVHTWTPSDLERLAHTLLLPSGPGEIAPNRRWDVVLIDTPPGGTLISVQAARAAYKALFVTPAAAFGIGAIPKTMALVRDIRDNYHHQDLDVAGVILNEGTAQERRTSRALLQQLEAAQQAGASDFNAPLWPGCIPDYVVIPDSHAAAEPVSAFLALSESRAAAAKVCQIAEALAVQALDSIDHPQATAIKRAWAEAWPLGLRLPLVGEVAFQ